MLKKTIKKAIWLTAAIVFLVLALIGLMLPVIPQVPFFLASLFCFMRCCNRLEEWIRERHWFARLHAWAEQKHWFEVVRDHLPHPKLHRTEGSTEQKADAETPQPTPASGHPSGGGESQTEKDA